ncbi:MAG: hypothetical protein ACAH88_18590, partial [Roseimicrobium sp.]
VEAWRARSAVFPSASIGPPPEGLSSEPNLSTFQLAGYRDIARAYSPRWLQMTYAPVHLVEKCSGLDRTFEKYWLWWLRKM